MFWAGSGGDSFCFVYFDLVYSGASTSGSRGFHGSGCARVPVSRVNAGMDAQGVLRKRSRTSISKVWAAGLFQKPFESTRFFVADCWEGILSDKLPNCA